MVCTYLSLSHVHVHAVVSHRYRLQVEVSHAVDLELEGERRFQLPVDPVLDELWTKWTKKINFKLEIHLSKP